MIRMVANGVIDSHIRVRFVGIECLALFITDQSPHLQRAYHSEIIPQCLKLMKDETCIKTKSISVSTLINFLKGLNDNDDGEAQDSCKNVDIVEHYWDEIINIIH